MLITLKWVMQRTFDSVKAVFVGKYFLAAPYSLDIKLLKKSKKSIMDSFKWPDIFER